MQKFEILSTVSFVKNDQDFTPEHGCKLLRIIREGVTYNVFFITPF